MPEMVMKTSSNFCKLAKDFGIKLCGDRTAKKWAVYGRDREGFFYCDNFPTNYAGSMPSLHIERFKNHKWVRVDEKSRTTQMIWQVYVKSGKLVPMSYHELDCKRNRKIAAAKERREFKKDVSTAWRLQYGKHGSYCDGFPAAFCNWQKENTGAQYNGDAVKIKAYAPNKSEYKPDELTAPFCHTEVVPKHIYKYWAFDKDNNKYVFTKAQTKPYEFGQKVTLPNTKIIVEIIHFEKGERAGECAI